MPTDSLDSENVWSLLDDDQPIHPISAQNLDQVIRKARLGPQARVLDVGCGTGVWGQRILRMHPDASYHGLDIGEALITKAWEIAAREGTTDRVTFEVADVGTYPLDGRFDMVLLIGLPEVFGGVADELNAFRPHLAKGGTLVYGTGVWERPPTAEALAAMGETEDGASEYRTLIDSIIEAGWVPVYGHKSSTQEMDEYLWACIGALARRGFDGLGDSPATVADTRVMMELHGCIGSWIHHYREHMSMAVFLLRPLPSTYQPFCTQSYQAGRGRRRGPSDGVSGV